MGFSKSHWVLYNYNAECFVTQYDTLDTLTPPVNALFVGICK